MRIHTQIMLGFGECSGQLAVLVLEWAATEECIGLSNRTKLERKILARGFWKSQSRNYEYRLCSCPWEECYELKSQEGAYNVMTSPYREKNSRRSDSVESDGSPRTKIRLVMGTSRERGLAATMSTTEPRAWEGEREKYREPRRNPRWLPAPSIPPSWMWHRRIPFVS